MANYPFLRFWTVVLIHTAYWISFIELGILDENDDAFQLTYGQVSSVGILVSRPLVSDAPVLSGDCCVRDGTPGR